MKNQFVCVGSNHLLVVILSMLNHFKPVLRSECWAKCYFLVFFT